jgi:hypothetical protein
VHISKSAFAALLVLALVGAFTVYEFAKPYALAYFDNVRDGRGWELRRGNYDGSDDDSKDNSREWSRKKQRGPEWDRPEAGGWKR